MAHLNLTICSPKGATWTTDQFSADATVGELIEAAIAHFADAKNMSPGDCELSHVVYGYPSPPLDRQARLVDTYVSNGSLLALLVCKPVSNAH
jgi:hypothetical protein